MDIIYSIEARDTIIYNMLYDYLGLNAKELQKEAEVLEKMQSLAQKRDDITKERDICALSVEKTAKEISELKVFVEDEENN